MSRALSRWSNPAPGRDADVEDIVAVNKDAEAPIFDIADFGVVGDLFEVAPALTELIKQRS